MFKIDESDPIGEVDPSFPYRDVQFRRNVDIKEFYELQEEIGRGKFGTVYRCREKSTGLQLAAKLVATGKREDRRNVEREVDIMRILQHPRIIQLYDAFDNGKVMCVVLELIEGGELFERVIDDDFVLTEKACTIFMRQICEGIQFIHQNNILHLDMKPENILCLTKTGNRIKIIDFGLARKYDPDKKLQVLFGTPEFVAPEIVNFDQIGFGTDMWSVGVICYVLLSGLSPFMGETDIETMANVTIAKYDYDDEVFNEISVDAKDFISKLLVKDKEQRMTATECLEHKWLKRKPLPPPTPVEDELDIAKDNLRYFVERWNEHPDSPYQFDPTSQLILPRHIPNHNIDKFSSHNSLRGFSPSPCESLSSSPDSTYDYGLQHQEILHNPQLEKLQMFERRASDSSCVVKNTGDVEVRMNLADEIRKLSDKLSQMAAIINHPTESNFSSYSNNNINQTDALQPIKVDNISTSVSSSSSNQANASASSSHENTMYTTTHTVTQRVFTNNFTSSNFNRNQQFENASSLNYYSLCNTPPAVKRTKFRMSNMNRDVPLGMAPPPPSDITNYLSSKQNKFSCSENFSFPHQNGLSTPSSGFSSPHSAQPSPEPENSSPFKADVTKDLLLQLLNKWEDKQPTPTVSRNCARKSFSVEWSEDESLGQRTMNSLANFFQSSRSTEKKQPIVSPQFGVP